MAITVKNQTLADSKKIAVIHATGIFTATTGEEADVVKVDVSALEDAPSSVKILRIWYSNSVPGTFLEFDGATDAMAIMIEEGSNFIDYRSIGGLQNNATTPTGDITLTTLGTAAAGNGYSITIEVSKS